MKNAETTVTASAETTEKKIASIENTVEKQNIRYDIVSQVTQMLSYKENTTTPMTTLESVTLCAEHWYFESLLNNAIRQAFYLKNIPEVKLHGVEMTKTVAEKALKNRPANADITCCSYDEFFKYENNVKKSGTSFITETERTSPLLINFAWADYCRPANLEAMESFAKMIGKNFDQGIAYVTFCIKPRSKGGAKELLNDFQDYCKSKKLRKGIKVTINRLLNKYARGKVVKCIYDVVYGGGRIGNTTMITLGFSVDLPSSAIKPVIEDRMEIKNETRMGNYQAYLKMKARKKWQHYMTGRPHSARTLKLASPESIKLDKAVSKYESKWDSLKLTKKNKIATKHNVTLRQFACMVACRHGKHKDRRIAA